MELKYGDIALMWRGGCIIALFLDIKAASTRTLFESPLDPFFKGIIENCQESQEGSSRLPFDGRSVPAFSSSIAYFDSYIAEQLPANLLQAQRDISAPIRAHRQTARPVLPYCLTDKRQHNINDLQRLIKQYVARLQRSELTRSGKKENIMKKILKVRHAVLNDFASSLFLRMRLSSRAEEEPGEEPSPADITVGTQRQA